MNAGQTQTYHQSTPHRPMGARAARRCVSASCTLLTFALKFK